MKKISIILIALSIVGFIMSNIKRDKKKVYEKKYSATNEITDTLKVITGKNYIISFYCMDEEPEGFTEMPEVQSSIHIFNADSTLYRKKLTSFSDVNRGGYRKAEEYTDYQFKAVKNDDIYIETKLHEGDANELIIFSDLSEEMNILPGIFIIILVIGVFLFMKFRNKSNN